MLLATYVCGCVVWLWRGILAVRFSRLNPLSNRSLTNLHLAGGGNRGKSTNYDAMGTPVSGCGVPPDMYGDRLWVALNSGRDDGGMGMFEDGANCGRWIEIRLGKNCIMDCEHDDVDESSARPPQSLPVSTSCPLCAGCLFAAFCCFSAPPCTAALELRSTHTQMYSTTRPVSYEQSIARVQTWTATSLTARSGTATSQMSAPTLTTGASQTTRIST